jgi:hypothetical protein
MQLPLAPTTLDKRPFRHLAVESFWQLDVSEVLRFLSHIGNAVANFSQVARKQEAGA